MSEYVVLFLVGALWVGMMIVRDKQQAQEMADTVARYLASKEDSDGKTGS